MTSKRKKTVKRLDDVFSLYIRHRDNFTCVVCGKTRGTTTIQCGHMFSRVSYSTRWDERNAHAQCVGCNMRHEYDFEPYRKIYIDIHGQDVYDEVYRAFKKPMKISSAELEDMIQYYKNKLEEVK